MPMQSTLDLKLAAPSVLVIMSISAPYAEKILAGTKQIELRRNPVRFAPGTQVLIYHTQPVQAIVGSFTVAGIVSEAPDVLWRQYASSCGISESNYWAYFQGAQRAYGIVVSKSVRWKVPLYLQTLRAIWPLFNPPQRYCLVKPTHVTYNPLVRCLTEAGGVLLEGHHTASCAPSSVLPTA